ncbi:MAG: MFS transporter, partial [Nitratireductor sp.]|nr:MFS transporter [Nitratireductor sp.]
MNIQDNATAASTGPVRHAPLSLGAFVAILAALMSLNALATDIMLPGFPDIAGSLGLASETQVQPVITLYLVGFGLSQLFMGFL